MLQDIIGRILGDVYPFISFGVRASDDIREGRTDEEDVGILPLHARRHAQVLMLRRVHRVDYRERISCPEHLKFALNVESASRG